MDKKIKEKLNKELEYIMKCYEECSMTCNAIEKSIEDLRIKVELFKKHDII